MPATTMTQDQIDRCENAQAGEDAYAAYVEATDEAAALAAALAAQDACARAARDLGMILDDLRKHRLPPNLLDGMIATEEFAAALNSESGWLGLPSGVGKYEESVPF